jgi:hypothetical protein
MATILGYIYCLCTPQANRLPQRKRQWPPLKSVYYHSLVGFRVTDQRRLPFVGVNRILNQLDVFFVVAVAAAAAVAARFLGFEVAVVYSFDGGSLAAVVVQAVDVVGLVAVLLRVVVTVAIIDIVVGGEDHV